MFPPIAGIVPLSTIDYPDKLSAVLFTSGCNYRCSFCHNKHLIDYDGDYVDDTALDRFLTERQGFLDAIVISGGEPTIHEDLPLLIEKIKGYGYLVGLHTNGSNVNMLERIKNNLDYVLVGVHKVEAMKAIEYLQLNEVNVECIKITKQEPEA